MPFVPCLDLSRQVYEELIAPLLAAHYPGLPYAAATYGMCSEAIGLDDEVSMDHNWGPRVTLLLSEADHARLGNELMALLRAQLPATFRGFRLTWLRPGVDVQDTREEILYNVRVTNVANALRFCGGAAALPLKDVDWLRVSEQHLFEFTNGVIYRDDTGEFTHAREALAYYPDDIWRFLLMGAWSALGGEWFPIGRMGARGDGLGVRIQAARAAQHLMRLAFLASKQYTTYRKWFGTLFGRLPIADELTPVLAALLREEDWRAVEERIWEAAAILLRHQNALGIAPHVTIGAKPATDGRHHLDCDYWGIARRSAGVIPPGLRVLQENEVFWLHEKQLILGNQETAKWILFLQKETES